MSILSYNKHHSLMKKTLNKNFPTNQLIPEFEHICNTFLEKLLIGECDTGSTRELVVEQMLRCNRSFLLLPAFLSPNQLSPLLSLSGL